MRSILLVGWLTRVDQYFTINSTREDIKCCWHWFVWKVLPFIGSVGFDCSPTIFWTQLSWELLHRYEGDMHTNLYERLATIRQDTLVDNYIDSFVALAFQMEGGY